MQISIGVYPVWQNIAKFKFVLKKPFNLQRYKNIKLENVKRFTVSTDFCNLNFHERLLNTEITF